MICFTIKDIQIDVTDFSIIQRNSDNIFEISFKKCNGCPVFSAHLVLILKVYNTYVREKIMIRGVRRTQKGGGRILIKIKFL